MSGPRSSGAGDHGVHRALGVLSRVVFGLALAASLYGFLAPVPGEPARGSDKVAHALIFLVLTLTARWAGLRPVVAGLSLAAYGALVEVLQSTSFIGRDGDIRDWVADVTGIVLGLALAWVIGLALARRTSRAA